MHYRFLSPEDLTTIHDTYVAAFSDYAIRQDRSEEELHRLMIRRGICFELSVGAFEGGQMVGITALGLGTHRGRPAAYDIFTGVRPRSRGRRIAGSLLEHARPALLERGAELVVLEVLQGNAAALSAYRRAGFEVKRELVCLELPAGTGPEPRRAEGTPAVKVDEVDYADWRLWSGFWDWQPSWQNSRESIERSLNGKRLLVARQDGRTVGYAVLVSGADDLPQLCVHSAFRRQGVGTALVAAVRRRHGTDRTLRLVNIDAGSEPDLEFWRRLGAVEFARQFEMVRAL